MNTRQMVKRYCLEHDMLPYPNGITVARISHVDYREYNDNTGQKQIGYDLFLQGFRVPLRLNNTRIKILELLYGEETDHWPGQLVGLQVGVVVAYGTAKPSITIAPQRPLENATPVDEGGNPLGESGPRATLRPRPESPFNGAARGAEMHGASAFMPCMPSVATMRSPAPATSAMQEQLNAVHIGIDKALVVLDEMQQRGVTINRAREHVARCGAGSLVSGVPIDQWPESVLPHLKVLLRYLPRSRAPWAPTQVAVERAKLERTAVPDTSCPPTTPAAPTDPASRQPPGLAGAAASTALAPGRDAGVGIDPDPSGGMTDDDIPF